MRVFSLSISFRHSYCCARGVHLAVITQSVLTFRQEINNLLLKKVYTSTMSFCIYDSDIVLCTNEQVVIYNLKDDTDKTIQLPALEADKNIDSHNNVNIEAFHTITNASYSNDGSYFFVCTNRKQLCLYERKNCNLLSNRTLTRAASKVRFTPGNDIVVADKTGDAYLFPNNKTDNTILLLGHLSMLLDIIVTEDERYIVTTDRDEKIRVSTFPNAYNITSYCLGHKKFVTNILELPHDKSILVSCGGDGVFILWNYESGKKLLSVDFRDKIPKIAIEKFNRKLQDCQLDETVEILPVKHLRLSRLNGTSSLAATSFYDSTLVLVYAISGTSESTFKATYIQSIIVDYEPIECHFHKGDFWLLNQAGFQVYKFEDNNFVASNAISDSKANKLNSIWKTLKKDSTKQNLFPILYKRKYDNVQEYLERKKTRLSSA